MKKTMMRLFILVMVFTVSAFAEDKGGKDQLKKEMLPLEAAVEEAVNSAAPGMGARSLPGCWMTSCTSLIRMPVQRLRCLTLAQSRKTAGPSSCG